MLRLVISVFALLSFVAGCDRAERARSLATATDRSTAVPIERTSEPDPEGLELTPASRFDPQRRSEPIRVVDLALGDDREVFALRGARGDDRIVFLHGLCGHGKGYLQSFQNAAAEHGLAVAPNGDMACPGKGQRTWSHEVDAIDAYIVEALGAAGVDEEPRGVTLIGYSLGASRAEQLARAHPERYDAIVLIGGPQLPSPRGLDHLRAAVMVAGERDRQDLMKKGARAFRAAGIPSDFFELPEAMHGEMGPESERVMGEVLAWLEAPPSE